MCAHSSGQFLIFSPPPPFTCVQDTCISIGDNLTGAALRLDARLREGWTEPTWFFANPALDPAARETRGLFQVYNVEAWGFKD